MEYDIEGIKSMHDIIELSKKIILAWDDYNEEWMSLPQLTNLINDSVSKMNSLHPLKLKECKNCHKMFFTSSNKTAYCNREDESGMRCSSIGSIRNFQRKMDAEYPLKIYNRAYKTHHSRYKKGSMSPNEFQLWCIEAKEKLRKVRIGDLEISTFEEWLKK